MSQYDFRKDFEFSKGRNEENDIWTINRMLHGCVKCVVSTDVSMDKHGVDYVATLRKGAQVFIDAKARRAGCSRWWQHGEEVAIEVWSIMPGGKYNTPDSRKRTGWTLDESKITDLILFTWDKSDCDSAYLLGFHTLRVAASKNVGVWRRKFKTDVQDSKSWESLAVFVPICTVLDAMADVQRLQHRFATSNRLHG